MTEESPDAPYDERKAQALAHVTEMTNDQVLLKSADVISNMTELIHDYEEFGETVFERFSTNKVKKLEVQRKMIEALIERRKSGLLVEDLREIIAFIERIE